MNLGRQTEGISVEVDAAPPRSCEIVQQRPSFLQIRRVEALAEPAEYRRKQVVCCLSPAPALPELRQDHRCPQLERLGLLAASDLDGSVEAGLGILYRRRGLQQFTVHPMDLGFEKPFVECARMLRGGLDPIDASGGAARLYTRLR
jgi:hypothetical protein